MDNEIRKKKGKRPVWLHYGTKRILPLLFLCLPFVCLAIPCHSRADQGSDRSIMDQPVRLEKPQRLNLEQCIDLALKYNRMRKASKASREIAESQYKQALSAYWPQLSLTSTGTRMKNPLNFIFPGTPPPLGNSAAPLAQSIAVTQLIAMGLIPG